MPRALVRYESPALLSSRRALASSHDLRVFAFRRAELQLGHSVAFVCRLQPLKLQGLKPFSNQHFPPGLKSRPPKGTAPRTLPYFARSRCTTLEAYPFWCSVLRTASASITERCRPPVQPKAIVR